VESVESDFEGRPISDLAEIRKVGEALGAEDVLYALSHAQPELARDFELSY
jgi:hypothetical protein